MSLKFLSTERATPSRLDTARSTSGKYEGSRNLRRGQVAGAGVDTQHTSFEAKHQANTKQQPWPVAQQQPTSTHLYRKAMRNSTRVRVLKLSCVLVKLRSGRTLESSELVLGSSASAITLVNSSRRSAAS